MHCWAIFSSWGQTWQDLLPKELSSVYWGQPCSLSNCRGPHLQAVFQPEGLLRMWPQIHSGSNPPLPHILTGLSWDCPNLAWQILALPLQGRCNSRQNSSRDIYMANWQRILGKAILTNTICQCKYKNHYSQQVVLIKVKKIVFAQVWDCNCTILSTKLTLLEILCFWIFFPSSNDFSLFHPLLHILMDFVQQCKSLVYLELYSKEIISSII